jgi:hypothetical protein
MRRNTRFILVVGLAAAAAAARTPAQDVRGSEPDTLERALERQMKMHEHLRDSLERLYAKKAERMAHEAQRKRGLRFDFELQGMDSVLKGIDSLFKHLPIPEKIQLGDGDFILRPRKPTFVAPQITEREGIVKFGEDVVVGRYELVHGNVVVFGGNATVYGEVEGGVAAVKGDVSLASTARVDGDILCLLGNADVAEGAASGQTTVLNLGRLFQRNSGRPPVPGRPLWIFLFRVLFLCLAAVLVVSAFPRQTRAVSDRVRGQYARSVAWGLMGILLVPVVFLVLLVTIIGIPVALLGLPLALAAAFLLGGAAVAFRVGQIMNEQFRLNWRAPALLVCAGLLLLEALAATGRLAALAGSWLGQASFLVGAFVFCCAWVPGFGAVLLTRFGTRGAQDAEPQEKKRARA